MKLHPALMAIAAALLAAPAGAQTAPVRLSYSAYSSGFNVIDLQASMALTPQNYVLRVSFHLTGIIGTVVHGQFQTQVDGRFQGTQVEPRELYSTGLLRGQERVTQIDWQNGQPVVTQMVPPNESERDPVPTTEQAHTIDTLSAMAALLHRVNETGRCEGAANTFDGRRLSSIEAVTVGEEELPKTSRSIFAGQALRCDFTGRQLAGFKRDEDQEALRRPQHGSAWFARLQPGEPPVPVRIRFESRLLGETTMYLTGVN